MFDLPKMLQKYNIQPRGIIHLGAHQGKEAKLYQSLKSNKILLVEANPEIFTRLEENIKDIPEAQAVNCAISNENGKVTLHITSMDQSSSILPLKRLTEYYSMIQESRQIDVPSKKLDTLLEELNLNPSDFNFLNIDIQGAELLALEGAINLLPHIEAINTEINYVEFYENCALIDQVDEFLENHGFITLDAIYTPYSQPIIVNDNEVFQNVNFWGFFQDHTRYYAPYKTYFRSLFQPIPELKKTLNIAWNNLALENRTVVALHLRRNDFGFGYFFIAPSKWYQDWLEGLWETLDNPILYIASDNLDQVVHDFYQYNPITCHDLGISILQDQFYVDFWMLTQANIVATSDSSFSIAACLLNEKAKFFFRPHLTTEKLIPFDPWHSETVFTEATVEEHIAKKYQDDQVNLIILPDWQQSEEIVYQDLSQAINIFMQHPQIDRLRLFVLFSKISIEEVYLIISDIVMNIFLETNLSDLNIEPQIEPIHWMKNFKDRLRIRGRIALSHEDQGVLSETDVPRIDLNNLTFE